MDYNNILDIVLRIILFGLVIIAQIICIWKCKNKRRKKWRQVSEEQNNAENKIQEPNIAGSPEGEHVGDTVDERGDCEDRGRYKSLMGDYGGGVYGGNYSNGKDIGSGFYGEEINKESNRHGGFRY